MKQLRYTIREILLENNDHYEKLATMLCTGDLESINQAIELAETLDLMHRVEYKTNTERKTNHWGKDRLVHQWTFSVPRQFKEIIRIEWDKTPSHNRRFGTFVVYPRRNHSIGIKLVETLGD